MIENCVNEGTVLGSSAETGGIGGWLFFTNVLGCANHGSISSCGSAGGIMGVLSYFTSVRDCVNDGPVRGGNLTGGIIGSTHHGMHQIIDVESIIRDCHNYGEVLGFGTNENSTGGGIVGRVMTDNGCVIVDCSNHGNITIDGSRAGGIVGSGLWSSWRIILLNSYNVGRISAHEYVGGILGHDVNDNSIMYNVWNAGEIVGDESAQEGSLFGLCHQSIGIYDSYWLANDLCGALGQGPTPQHSCAFSPTELPTEWQLDSLQYGTHDLLAALNAGTETLEGLFPEAGPVRRWKEDVDLVNGGFPVLGDYSNHDYHLMGTEWYYEIVNPNGNVTYQHLEYLADTTIGNERPKVIVRTNQIYDKESQKEVTHEYIYERDNKVYWWNKELEQFTLLYDFAAQIGDSWTILVGSQNLVVSVKDVSGYVVEGNNYRVLHVSDEQNLFTGDIVCGIGHLTSFFPERLMSKDRGYQVDGLRCYWEESKLVFKMGDKDCDEIYENYHYSLDEPFVESGLIVYPNPSSGVLFVENGQGEYRIVNLLGQTVMSGTLKGKPIDISKLSNGFYLLKTTNTTIKIIVNQ